MSALTPRLATRQPIKRQCCANYGAMLLKCLERIRRAGRLKTTSIAKPWTKKQAINPNEADQNPPRQVVDKYQTANHALAAPERLAAKPLSTSSSNSLRTASFNDADDALANSLRENSRRSLIKKAPEVAIDVKLALKI